MLSGIRDLSLRRDKFSYLQELYTIGKEGTFMKNKIMAAVSAAAVMLLSAAAPIFAAAPAFSDISEPKYEWAAGYIEDMADRGFISGYSDGTYKPDNSVTRLEVLSLFARAMGSSSEANKDALAAAEEQYLEVVEKYNLNFGESDIAYLLYRGALKESELSTYLRGDLKSQPMPRHEAAVIITKAMCGEKEATSEIMIDLDYTDARKIPASSSQYVYYVTKKGIMSGMGDGTFSPESEVLRSQIAVMLSNTVDNMNLTIEELKIAGIDNSNVAFYDEDNKEDYMGYSDNTRFYLEGKLIQAKNIPSDVHALFTYVDNELVFVDIPESVPDETIKGVYQGYSTNNSIVTVTVKTDDGNKSYQFVSGVTLIREGQKAGIRDFKKSDLVTLELSGGKIRSMTGEEMSKSIVNATIEDISIVRDGTITISHANEQFDGLTLEVSGDVKVRKNDSSASLSEVYKGDIVKLTLEYGVVTEIVAASTSRVVEGTIVSIEISSSPKMTVNVKGTETAYDLTNNIEIVVNGKEGSIYDFRVGDTVTITIESQAIKKITATAVSSTAYSKSGVITNVNTAYGFIKISYKENDVTFEETVYCKDNTTKFITSEGATKTLKELREGDTVSVRGTMTNGAFEASLILIEIE